MKKPIKTPSAHQLGDMVTLIFQQRAWTTALDAEVIGVHFYSGKVKYDLEIPLNKGQFTRIYNVDSLQIPVIKELKSEPQVH